MTSPLRVTRYPPRESRWRRWGEDAAAWLLITSAAFVGCLLALLAWHLLIGR